jgi:hypothetical protein
MKSTETCHSCVYYLAAGVENPQWCTKKCVEIKHDIAEECDELHLTPIARIALALEIMSNPIQYSPIVGPRGTKR